MKSLALFPTVRGFKIPISCSTKMLFCPGYLRIPAAGRDLTTIHSPVENSLRVTFRRLRIFGLYPTVIASQGYIICTLSTNPVNGKISINTNP